MVRTRKQVRDTGETQSQDSSSNKRRRAEEEEPDSDEELIIPAKAVRGRYKQAYLEAYEKFVDLVHNSSLPLYRNMIKRPKDAIEAFILACAEIFLGDEGIEDDRDESEIERSADNKTSEEEFVSEGETEDEDGLEEEVDALEDHSSDVIAASASEDEENYDDDDEVEKIE